MHTVSIDHHVVRAVHRTKNEGLTLNFHGREHVFFVMIPVTGSLVQIYRTDTGSHNVFVTQLALFGFNIIFQLLPYDIAFGKEHRQTTSNQIVGHKQLHIFTNLSVVTLLGFLQQFQMLFQLFGSGEAHTVDTLQDMVVGIAFPVHTRMFYQFKIAAELHVVYMRSAAKICEVALIINRDLTIFQIADQIQLVHIVFEQLHSLCLGNLTADDLFTTLGDFFHFFFDSRDIFITDDIITEVNIVVKSFRYHRSYPEFCLGIQVFDSLCHQMSTGMVQCVQSFIVFEIYHFSLLLLAKNKKAPMDNSIQGCRCTVPPFVSLCGR